MQKVQDAFQLGQAADFLVGVDIGPILDAGKDSLVCQLLVFLDELADRLDELLAELREVLQSVHR